MELSREMRERFSKDVELPREMLFGALHEALKKIDGNCKTFINTYPRPCSTNYIYPGILMVENGMTGLVDSGQECCGLLMK